ncbi:MAG: ribose 5-phosphate isomerase B [Candidatus Omnitrophica bacterium]|nr:ribose 5-phosphate isomerase B [Candidatus Omnitrophota bacterium]
MKIYIGADHRGFPLKDKIVKLLGRRGYAVEDVGTFDEAKSHDYPKVAYRVAKAVARTRGSRGVLVCMSGIGQAIAANKVRGAYAALCYNVEAAALSRQHNNANILVLGAKFVKEKEPPKILDAWLTAKFEGGRHARRFEQIQKIEKGSSLK